MRTVQRRLILIVEDDLSYAEIVTYWLTEIADPAWAVHLSVSLHEALTWLQDHTPVVVWLDLNLPDSKEQATFDRMWAACVTREVPIVVITALKGTHLEGNIVAGGAVWYCDKMWVAAHMETFLQRLDSFTHTEVTWKT